VKRRTFLKIAGGAGAAVALGLSRARADSFGKFPAGSQGVQLPANARAKKVLEVFLYGGLSQWETLYYVRDYGKPTDPRYPNTQYYAFAAENQAAMATCGAVDQARPFSVDENGATVELGPFAAKLWDRADITARMRIVVQRHNLEPHEAAVPQALTGRPVGQPNAAGLGAHVQRARIDQGATPGRASPYAYVFATGGFSSDNVAAAASSGIHPGAARPLLIKTDNAAGFTRLLERSTVGASRANTDALVGAYVDQYNARLAWPKQGRVRSARTDDFAAAYQTTKNVDGIRGVLTADLFATRPGESCGSTRTADIPIMGLNAARHVLTHPTEPASYVCVSDIGLYEASGGGGYDVHLECARDTSTNFNNLLGSLLDIIDVPGGNDPTKISLDDTLVILNTEFGRTPGRQLKGTAETGRNHHPYGYATVFIGGPVTTAQRGLYGAIGPDGLATTFATPAENRIAALLALGIWPFSPEAFAVSDVPGATGEIDAASRAMTKFLGRTM
jgi:hypothetical protein